MKWHKTMIHVVRCHISLTVVAVVAVVAGCCGRDTAISTRLKCHSLLTLSNCTASGMRYWMSSPASFSPINSNIFEIVWIFLFILWFLDWWWVLRCHGDRLLNGPRWFIPGVVGGFDSIGNFGVEWHLKVGRVLLWIFFMFCSFSSSALFDFVWFALIRMPFYDRNAQKCSSFF